MGSKRAKAQGSHAFFGSDDFKKCINERPKGHISREFTFWCGACEIWNQYCARTQADATVDAKEEGWRLTSTWGWICPAHKLERGVLLRRV